LTSLLNADGVWAQSGRFQKNKAQKLQQNEDRIRQQRVPPAFKRQVPFGGAPGNNPGLAERLNNPAINAIQKQRKRLLMEALSLTPDQRMRVMEINRSHDEEAIVAGRRLRIARGQLDRALMSETYNEALIKQYTEELAAAQAEQIRINARVRAEFRSVLTIDQVRRYIEKEKEINRQIREEKEKELLNQQNRPPNQQQELDKDRINDDIDFLDLFK
jgi:Spy/CpxP family protein refolding chaperone